MSKTESGSVSLGYLTSTFGDQFKYISPWVMASNVLQFAPREHVHDPRHRHFAKTKTISEKNDSGFVTTLWLERDSDHASMVHLRGTTQIGQYASPFAIEITKDGAFDLDGLISGGNERNLVNLLHRFMRPDDPNAAID